jgi:putative membrane protein
MIPIAWLPTVNACLNTLAGICIVIGVRAVRRRQVRRHRAWMLAAVTCSALFLTSYLYYHAHAGATRFAGRGVVRAAYLAVLGSHTVLAALILPLVVTTLARALRRDWSRHRRIARVTYPVWVYVSATGVIVYLMLYHLVPSR